MASSEPYQREYEKNELVPENYFAELSRSEICPDDSSLEIDLGCGDGSFLIEMAANHPDRRFIGVERLLGRVRKVSRKADRKKLTNVKVLRLESLYTVEYLLPAQSCDRVHLLFPDPWPKKRHHRRRMMSHPFLDALKRILKPDGEFLFKTDHEEYFDWAKEVMNERDDYEELPWATDDFFYAETDFEQQWKAEGKKIQGIRCKQKTGAGNRVP